MRRRRAISELLFASFDEYSFYQFKDAGRVFISGRRGVVCTCSASPPLITMNERTKFDRWFRSLPFAQQAKLRKEGVIPYDEMPIEDNVFPVIEDHKMWTVPSEEARTESSAYMSEEEVRERLSKVFEALEKFADKNMKKHLRFLRSMLGSGSTEPLSHLAKDFGITKQAMTWRARQLRAALGRVAMPKGELQTVKAEPAVALVNSAYTPCITRDTYDDDFGVIQKISAKYSRDKGKELITPVKESPSRGGIKRVAAHPGEKMGKNFQKRPLLAKPAKPRKR